MSGLFRYNSTPTRPNTLSPFCVSGQDATMDSSFAFGYRSPSASANLLSGNGAAAGSTSPGQGRSLRDYDEKLHVLQKENFNLKLRLFFLEEKSTTTVGGGGGSGGSGAGGASTKSSEDETLFKQNVDLKVENGELRKELQEKQDLLCQAAKAMELMEESQRKSHDKSSITISDLSQKNKYLEDELRSMEKSSHSSSPQSVSGTFSARSPTSAEVDHTAKIAELEQSIRQSEQKISEITDDLVNAQRKLTERNTTVEKYEQHVEELELQLTKLQRAYENSRSHSMDVSASDDLGELRKLIHVQKQTIADHQCNIQELEEKLAAKTRAHDKGCQTIHLLLIKTSELAAEVEQLTAKAPATTVSPTPNTAAAEVNSLKSQLIQAQNDAEQANRWRKECVELCGVLTIRLNELAGFLDSLLNHKDVLGVLAQDRHKAMRKAVDRSLDLSRSLNNMSISAGPTGRFSMNDQSLLQLSSLTEILNDSYFDASIRERVSLGVSPPTTPHTSIIDALRAEVQTLKTKLEKVNADTSNTALMEGTVRRDRSSRNLSHQFDLNSESEAWSEPDRKVSHERIGLDESIKMNTHVRSPCSSKFKATAASSSGSDDNNESRLVRKNTMLRLQEKVLDLEVQLAAKTSQLALLEAKSSPDAEAEHIKIIAELNAARDQIATLQTEMVEMKRVYVSAEQTYERKLNKCRDDFSRCDAERREHSNKMRELEQEISVLVDEHARKMETMASKHAATLQSLRLQYNKDLEEEGKRMKEQTERDWVSRVTYQEKLRKCHELGERLDDMEKLAQLMRDNEIELKAQIADKEKTLRAIKRNADDATMQMSKAVLERTKFLNERDKFEKMSRELQEKCDRMALEKSELHSKLASLAHNNAQLHNKLVVNETQFQLTRSASQDNARYALATSPKSISCMAILGSGGEQSGYTSDELKQRLENSSPDLGIESDGTGRSSGTDVNPTRSPLSKLRSPKSELNASYTNILLEGDEDDDSDQAPNPSNGHTLIKTTPIPLIVQHDCEKIEKENAALRRKLERTRRAFEKTWAQLRISNQRKEQIEKDIRQEIYKTHSVLMNVRSNIESVNKVAKKIQIHINEDDK